LSISFPDVIYLGAKVITTPSLYTQRGDFQRLPAPRGVPEGEISGLYDKILALKKTAAY
jgi:hypothetical protein